MFINLPKKQNILSVDNQRQFYTLIDEDDTHLTYKIFYNIDVMSAIRAGSAKIKILIANYDRYHDPKTFKREYSFPRIYKCLKNKDEAGVSFSQL